MPKFGRSSRAKLNTSDQRLQEIAQDVVEVMDITIIYGERNEAQQKDMIARGVSQLSYPHSKHNSSPSQAVDVAPWVGGTIPWDKPEYFYIMAGHFMQSAHRRGYKIRWGGDWNSNGTIVKYDTAEKLNDLGHFEVVD